MAEKTAITLRLTAKEAQWLNFLLGETANQAEKDATSGNNPKVVEFHLNRKFQARALQDRLESEMF